MQQATPKGSDCVGLGKHRAKTNQEVLQVDHEYCRWQVQDQRSQWELKRFSSWLRMQSVFYQEPNLVNNMTEYDETHQPTRGGEDLRRNASVE